MNAIRAPVFQIMGEYMRANKLLTALATSTILIAPSVAAAESGPYVGAYGGLNFLNESDLDTGISGVDADADFETGFALGAVAGYTYDADVGRADGLAIRGELDIGYRQNSLDSVGGSATIGGSTLSGSTGDVDGDVSTLSGLANAWVDYKVGRFTPYIGGGIGLANVSVNDVSILGVDAVDDSDTVFAYQLGGGVAYSLTSSASLTLDYRYFATADPEFTDAAGDDFEAEIGSHSILAGVRFGF